MTFRIDYIYMGEHLKDEKIGLRKYSKPEHYRNKNIQFTYNITCMRSCVPFQVKSIIESFAAECT